MFLQVKLWIKTIRFLTQYIKRFDKRLEKIFHQYLWHQIRWGIIWSVLIKSMDGKCTYIEGAVCPEIHTSSVRVGREWGSRWLEPHVDCGVAHSLTCTCIIEYFCSQWVKWLESLKCQTGPDQIFFLAQTGPEFPKTKKE